MGHAEIRVIALGAGALALLLASGCGRSGDNQSSGNPQGSRQDAAVSVSPADGATQVAPELPIMIGTVYGALRSVEVRATSKNTPLEGVLSADRTKWRSKRPMAPGETYRVTVVAVGRSGKTTQLTSQFSTIKATQTFAADKILPNKDITGLTVGVGMPIMLTFDKPIADRLSVERNLSVQASRPVEGAWHWIDEKSVVYRPKHWWPAHTKVKLVAQLGGVRGGPGMYGAGDYVREFEIGRSQISHADTASHQMTVKRDGKVIRTVPLSAGNGDSWKHYTTNGIHLAMSREDVTTMTSPDAGPGSAGYYQLTVYDTVRISDTGEYVHGAPWSVGSQGNSNVSHGCINVSPENAKWFKEVTLIGDPIIVTGTPRQLDPGNGWGYWQESWPQWLRWSGMRSASPTEALSAVPVSEHTTGSPASEEHGKKGKTTTS
ncbi:L,D-transpeptidase [Sphaerisporangium fuscum]|uniref:L,D-transpeptidase n=1 Tax=Sphaerisporangium fuscum TaxID=2835868 RepID=UPI0027E2312C|nr:Ig-like domain-containing protein [Sphaerisporangium fuscum]